MVHAVRMAARLGSLAATGYTKIKIPVPMIEPATMAPALQGPRIL